MKKLVFLIGISGSGKSTVSKVFTNPNKLVLSSDETRIEMFKSLEEGNKHNGEVFQHMQNQMLDFFNTNEDGTVIYDATNLSRKQRTHVYKLVKNHNVTVESLIIFRNPKTAIEWNNTRSGYAKVPENVIEHQFMSLQVPRVGVDTDIIKGLGESWFNPTLEQQKELLIAENPLAFLISIATPEMAEILKLNYAPHDTPYHLESIDTHIQMVADETKLVAPKLTLSAIFHDIGKGYAKGRGINTRTNGQYRLHDSIGAQILLNYILVNNGDITETEQSNDVELVNQHMAAHQLNWNNTDKFQRKHNISNELLNDLKTFSDIDSRMRVTSINKLTGL